MEILTIVLISILIFIVVSITGYGIWKIAQDIAQSISGYGIPYVDSPDIKIEQLLEDMHLSPGEVFVDIGCGDGRVLEAVEKKWNKAHVIGYEISMRPYQDAIKRREENGMNYEIRHEDFFTSDIHNVQIFYCYMLPYMMGRIWNKISSECKSGTLLYSSSFPVPGKEAKKRITLKGDARIFVYEVE